jgi:hypothetical protein
MKELDTLVENYFTPALDATDILQLVEQIASEYDSGLEAAPDRGEMRNIELATNALDAEGLDYIVDDNRRRIVVKTDNRQEAIEDVIGSLELHGFRYNVDAPGSSLGRIEIIDKDFGNVYIYFKPISRKAPALAGADYELSLAAEINQRYSDIGVTASSAGSGHGSDLTIKVEHPMGTVTIEAKTSLSADFGQFRLQYNTDLETWEPRLTKGYAKNKEIFDVLFYDHLQKHMNKFYRFPDVTDGRLATQVLDKGNTVYGLKRTPTTGDLKRDLQLSWFQKNDYHVSFPFEQIADYYRNKGDEYIQIKGKGLYALEADAASKLKIPEFDNVGLTSYLRFRLKPSYGENSSTGFVVAVKLSGKMIKSSVDLDKPESLDKFVAEILK